MAHEHGALHGVDEESYFVSMTDLLVGMLFIFIILLMSFALNLRQQEARFDRTTEQLTEADKARRVMLESIKQSMERYGVKVMVDPENGVLRLPEELLFRRGEFLLTDAGKAALARLASSMEAVLPCYAKGPAVTEPRSSCAHVHGGRLEAVFIEGHTDDRAITGVMGNGIGSNWELSARRAIETLKALAPLQNRSLCDMRDQRSLACLVNDRNQQLLGVSGYAEFRPVVEEASESARAANRRIDLRFLMATPNDRELKEIQESVQKGKSAP
jgi:chemotaxis protein MotB